MSHLGRISRSIGCTSGLQLFQNYTLPRLTAASSPLRSTTNLHARSVRNRSFLSTSSTSKASLTSALPTQPTVMLYHPTKAGIEMEEVYVELLPPDKVKLEITDRAAEVSLPHT